jgi:hypothetical protein
MMWTIFEMEIILHHACSSAPFPRYTAPIYQETVERLRSLGIMDDGGAKTVTDLGHALIDLWRNTPLPVQRFVDPRLEKGSAA